MASRINAVFIIKLTHCSRQFNMAFIPLKAIIAGCKGTTKYPYKCRLSINANLSFIMCEEQSEPRFIESTLSHQDY